MRNLSVCFIFLSLCNVAFSATNVRSTPSHVQSGSTITATTESKPSKIVSAGVILNKQLTPVLLSVTEISPLVYEIQSPVDNDIFSVLLSSDATGQGKVIALTKTFENEAKLSKSVISEFIEKITTFVPLSSGFEIISGGESIQFSEVSSLKSSIWLVDASSYYINGQSGELYPEGAPASATLKIEQVNDNSIFPPGPGSFKFEFNAVHSITGVLTVNADSSALTSDLVVQDGSVNDSTDDCETKVLGILQYLKSLTYDADRNTITLSSRDSKVSFRRINQKLCADGELIQIDENGISRCVQSSSMLADVSTAIGGFFSSIFSDTSLDLKGSVESSDSRHLTAQETVNYNIVPGTYFVNGQFENLYTTSPFPITLETRHEGFGQMKVILRAVNTFICNVNYNTNDGWVNSVSQVSPTYISGTPDMMAVENRVRDIVCNVQQIAFETDGFTQFIKDSGATRISFLKTGSSSLPPYPSNSGIWVFEVNSYRIGGAYNQIFSSGPYDIFIKFESGPGFSSPGVSRGVLSGEADTYHFGMTTSADNSISVYEFTLAHRRLDAQPDRLETEARMAFLIQSAYNYKINNNAVVTLNSFAFGQSQLSFILRSDGYGLHSNMQSVDSINSNLQSLNSISSNVQSSGFASPNIQSVDSIKSSFGSVNNGRSLQSIVSNLQSVNSVNSNLDSNIHYVDSNLDTIGSNVQSIDSAGSNVRSGRSIMSVVPESYFSNGQFQPLFTGAPFQILVDTVQPYYGHIKVTVRAINTMVFDIDFNNRDGWVKTVRPVYYSQIVGAPDQMQTEAKIRNVIANMSQLAFEIDGTIQFIADMGNSRLSCRPFYNRHLFAVENRGFGFVEFRKIAPETFVQNGKFQSLYTGPIFPITLRTSQPYSGNVKVILSAVNTISFEVNYNVADGWVSNVQLTDATRFIGTPDQMATENKVKNIIGNVQQIAFENDGRVQFITDNGSTRISFDSSSGRRLSFVENRMFSSIGNQAFGSVETHQILPGTFVDNGVLQSLYTGPHFPVQLDSEIVSDGRMKVTVKAINTLNYDITYNTADGKIISVRPLAETHVVGTPDQMATEVKIKNIIGNVQQIAFQNDGLVQFISDNGDSRINSSVSSNISTS